MRIREDLRTPDFFERLLEYYDGNIIATDAEGNIIFASLGSPGIPGFENSQLMGLNIYETMTQPPYATGASTIKTLETKRQCYSAHFVGENQDIRILSYSKPVFDPDGRLRYVFSYSWAEKDLYAMIKRLDEEKSSVKSVITYMQNTDTVSQSFVAESALMRSLVAQVDRIAAGDSTVVLYGESGCGKEVFAKYIHAKSPRCKEVFIPVNCSAMPLSLLESELFGYEKGAFTGGVREGKAGLFEFANNGTLFLDEIGDCPLELQAKLLRTLENGEIRRVGGNRIITTNARVIAATNRDLQQLVREGKFRADLYYRLNVIPVTLPPLRERMEDLEPLVRRFVAQYNKKFNKNKIVSPSLLALMKQYLWPGNVRELRNCVERMVIISDSDVIDERAFPYRNECVKTPELASRLPGRTADAAALTYDEALAAFEKDYISRILEECGGEVRKAAARMQLHASTLYRKLEKYGMKA